jgi:hypothetical protein
MSIPNVSQTYLERIPTHHWDTHGYVHPFRIQHLPLMYPACILMYPTAIPGYMYPKCIHMFPECISYFPSMYTPTHHGMAHLLPGDTEIRERFTYPTVGYMYPGVSRRFPVDPSVSQCIPCALLGYMYLDVSWCILMYLNRSSRAPESSPRREKTPFKIHQDTSGYIRLHLYLKSTFRIHEIRRNGYVQDTFRIRVSFGYSRIRPGYVGIRRYTSGYAMYRIHHQIV